MTPPGADPVERGRPWLSNESDPELAAFAAARGLSFVEIGPAERMKLYVLMVRPAFCGRRAGLYDDDGSPYPVVLERAFRALFGA